MDLFLFDFSTLFFDTVLKKLALSGFQKYFFLVVSYSHKIKTEPKQTPENNGPAEFSCLNNEPVSHNTIEKTNMERAR